MKRLFAIALFAAAACGGPKKPVEETVPQDDVGPSECCCKHTEWGSEGNDTLETLPTFDCSQKSGTCVDDVQCQSGDNPPPGE